MQTWNTIVQAVFFDTTLSDVLGPYGMVAFLALAGVLFGVTLGVLVRGILEQVRGPETTRPRVVAAAVTVDDADEDADPAPASAA